MTVAFQDCWIALSPIQYVSKTLFTVQTFKMPNDAINVQVRDYLLGKNATIVGVCETHN